MALHNHKCTKCDIVWNKLWSEDDVDFCPQCKSDMGLIECYEAGYTMCPFTGKITDMNGVELSVEKTDHKIYPSNHDKFLIAGMVQYKKLGTQEERDARADKIIEQHINGCNV